MESATAGNAGAKTVAAKRAGAKKAAPRKAAGRKTGRSGVRRKKAASRPATTRVFRQRLKAARTRLGWSQSDLARAAGLQPSALSHYESGTRRPSFTNLRRLACALRVSTDYLVGHAAPTKSPADDLAAQIALLRPADRETVRALVGSLSRRAR